jgi:hypothetical protein
VSTEHELGKPEAPTDRSAVAEMLAGYLLAAPRFHCPGVDGATVSEVVATEYRTAAAAGWVPRQAELASRHPDLADALGRFFPAR